MIVGAALPSFPHGSVLTVAHPLSVGFSASTVGNAAWPSANLALFIPLRLQMPVRITTITIWNGTAVSGNFDVGLYSADGVLLVSSGSTAQSGTNVFQTANVTDTTIGPGLVYFALACDNTTAQVARFSVSATRTRFAGCWQMASAFPLPATATFAQMAQAIVPIIAATVYPRTFL